jgi:hypothetical protein
MYTNNLPMMLIFSQLTHLYCYFLLHFFVTVAYYIKLCIKLFSWNVIILFVLLQICTLFHWHVFISHLFVMHFPIIKGWYEVMIKFGINYVPTLWSSSLFLLYVHMFLTFVLSCYLHYNRFYVHACDFSCLCWSYCISFYFMSFIIPEFHIHGVVFEPSACFVCQ